MGGTVWTAVYGRWQMASLTEYLHTDFNQTWVLVFSEVLSEAVKGKVFNTWKIIKFSSSSAQTPKNGQY